MGIKARSIRDGFKLFYHGVDGKTNGIGVILKEEYVKSYGSEESVKQDHKLKLKS